LPLVQPEGGLLSARKTTTQTEKLLQVGDLAKAAGKTVRAIHHYEELGLLKPDARSKGRFRLYDPSAVTRVRWIGKLHDLGMSLLQIQQVLSAWEQAPSPARAMADVRATYRERLEETRAQIARLSVLEHELEASIAYLDTCDSCDPTTLLEPPAQETSDNAQTCSACQLREREVEPDLVAGIVA
jgi:MerR family transcriptional regulator, copper efflux regulator